jgi:hypothetical protein
MSSATVLIKNRIIHAAPLREKAGMPCSYTGKHEKKGHEPHIKPAYEHQCNDALLSIVQMPGAAPEKSGAMEKEHAQHRQDPQPIDVVSSFFQDSSFTHLAECKSFPENPSLVQHGNQRRLNRVIRPTGISSCFTAPKWSKGSRRFSKWL